MEGTSIGRNSLTWSGPRARGPVVIAQELAATSPVADLHSDIGPSGTRNEKIEFNDLWAETNQLKEAPCRGSERRAVFDGLSDIDRSAIREKLVFAKLLFRYP